MKAVLDTKPDSAYDDEIAHRYQFPPRYFSVASSCIGDWVIFRRPRAGGGSKAYFATGQIISIEPDHSRNDYYYATIGRFLPFDHPVPWQIGGRYFEKVLRNLDKVSQVGVYLRGRSVRHLEEQDFADIICFGLGETLDPQNAISLGLDPQSVDPHTLEFLAAPEEEKKRRIEEVLVNRKIREANFRKRVCEAYDYTCAVTGLKILDSHGRAEVQAAHIWSVAEGGPDTTQNGIALSATVHWLFDRHLISLSDNYRLLTANHRIPTALLPLLQKARGGISLPSDRSCWPHPEYLERHRREFLEDQT